MSNRRTFAKVDTSKGGAADGSTVDAEGYLWTALVYDGRLVRYAPDGSVDRIIDMPVKKITSVMFGGPNLDILFVTSMARQPLPRFPGDGVLRGSLFAIYDLGIRGLPEITLRRLSCCATPASAPSGWLGRLPTIMWSCTAITSGAATSITDLVICTSV